MGDQDGLGQYRKVQLVRTPRTAETATPEQKYWRKFKNTTLTKGYAAVFDIDFCPTAPHDFAVTNSTRVQVYGSKGKTVKKTVTRFKDVVYSCSFRHDGKLMVASGEESDVKILDMNSRDLLRTLKGHKGPVHATKFCSGRLNVASGGDDGTVRYWDVATGASLTSLEGHSDHVRCLAQSPATPEVWVSGSYDHTVKLWDTRGGGSSVLSVDHGFPVQATLMLPGGGVLVTAGGTYMKVWDILSGGRLLQSVNNHTKTITCLAMDGEGGRLLSGGLDHLLKVYDVQEYRVRYSVDYTQPILSMGISPDKGTLAVGMSNGLLAVKSRGNKDMAESRVKEKRDPRAGTYAYFIRGQADEAGDDDYRVERVRKQRLQPFDKLLKAFSYGPALDAAIATQQPQVVASVLHELSLRDSVSVALSGRDEETVQPLLKFLVRWISDSRFTSLLTDVASAFLDIYTSIVGRSPSVDDLILKLKYKLHEQLSLHTKLLQLQGAVEMILASSAGAR